MSHIFRNLDRHGFFEVLKEEVSPYSTLIPETEVTMETPSVANATVEHMLPPGLYRQDLDGMLHYSLYQEVGKMQVIANKSLLALKDFIRILAKVTIMFYWTIAVCSLARIRSVVRNLMIIAWRLIRCIIRACARPGDSSVERLIRLCFSKGLPLKSLTLVSLP